MHGVHSFSYSVTVASICGYEIKGSSFVPVFKLKVHESYLERQLVYSDNYEYVVSAMITFVEPVAIWFSLNLSRLNINKGFRLQTHQSQSSLQYCYLIFMIKARWVS